MAQIVPRGMRYANCREGGHAPNSPYGELPAFDPESGDLNAVIDAPEGGRDKEKHDEKLGLFELSGVLPAGAVFPFDFG